MRRLLAFAPLDWGTAASPSTYGSLTTNPPAPAKIAIEAPSLTGVH